MSDYEDNLFYNASSRVKGNAKELRKRLTEAEKKLWPYLRSRKLNGVKFRRQHPIDIFIADFYCHEKRLVIEIDGKIHERKDNREYDVNRTAEMEKYGIRVIRFTNEEVMVDVSGVLKRIVEELVR